MNNSGLETPEIILTINIMRSILPLSIKLYGMDTAEEFCKKICAEGIMGGDVFYPPHRIEQINLTVVWRL